MENIIIKETGERKELDDFFGIGEAYGFEYDHDEDAYLCSQDTYDFYAEISAERDRIEEEKEKLSKEVYQSGCDKEELAEKIFKSGLKGLTDWDDDACEDVMMDVRNNTIDEILKCVYDKETEGQNLEDKNTRMSEIVDKIRLAIFV